MNAGNDDSDLQPMVKGNDLEYTLDNIMKLISDLHSSVTAAINFASIICSAVLQGPAAGLAMAKLALAVLEIKAATIDLGKQETNWNMVQKSYKDSYYEGYFKSKHNHVN